MKLSLDWLRSHLDLRASPEEIRRALTFVGFEVEGVHHTGLAPIEQLVAGEILGRERHPGADKLSVCPVRVAPGGAPLQIVCGAPNCDAGNRVLVALPGCVLPGDFRIKHSKIRGVESDGMMCSARELGLGDDASGLLLLEGAPEPGTPGHLALGGGDVVFDVEITPNRPDALSHLGLARELSAWFRLPLSYPEIRCNVPADDAAGAGLLEGVTVAAPEACPLYTAHLVAGVKVGPSPEWLRRALTSIGLRPVNNIVDVTNFVLHETGQPLHAFDAARIRGRRLAVRFAGEGERLVTLDGRERALGASTLVIADAERPLVVAGVMGGVDSGVGADTRDIVLESAIFAPGFVRRASKSLQLSSDSSYRFERGVDPHGVVAAARRALDLILETAGGSVVGPVHVVGAAPAAAREVVFSPDYVRERCGFEIGDDDQRDILQRLGMPVAREESGEGGRLVWTVPIPSWRGDLERPIDMVEEILRIHGTERIPATRPRVEAVVSADDPVAVFVRGAAAVLAGRGFAEAVNYTLRPAREAIGSAPEASIEALRVENPLAEDQSHLRSTLLPGLLETLRFNQARGNPDTCFFETGRTFRVDDGVVHEMVSCAFVLARPDSSRGWLRREPPDFFHAKSLVLELAALAGLKLRDEQFRPVEGTDSIWQTGHAASAGGFREGGEARVGLLDLAATRALGLDGPVLGGHFEAPPERLRRARAIPRFKPVSAFPAATRDLAVVCDEAVRAGDVQAALTRAARKALANAFALERVGLFDVYRGSGVPEGRKSLAFALTFRAADRTLTDDEVGRVFAAVQAEIEGAGYTIRK